MLAQQQVQYKQTTKIKMHKGILDPDQYKTKMLGRRFQIVGLIGQKSKDLNGKIGLYSGVQYEPDLRTYIKIPNDQIIYKIQPRNLVPQGYTLKTIHAPYQVMTLAEEQQIDKKIGKAQKQSQKQKEWKLCFKYIGVQTNYCFSCHQFGTACYGYCGFCGADYLRLLNVEKNKLMIFYKGCHRCMQGGVDLNLVGQCQKCWEI